MQPRRWISESGDPAPASTSPAGDDTRADDALKRVRAGQALVYSGDFRNAKQLLGAMGRRLEQSGRPGGRRPTTPLEAFRAERRARAVEHDTLSRLLVELDGEGRLGLANAPDVREACTWAWGPPAPEGSLVALKTLLGVLGATEWRRKGLTVPGLKGQLTPHYGVYLPTRAEYVELVAALPERDVRGKRVLDCGTGTGVLSFVLLQKGAASAVGTDLEPRALACARDNAERLGLAGRFEAVEADLFAPGRFDLVVCNPPWIPEPPKNRVDRAVFDEGSGVLKAWLSGLAEHLTPGGLGLLVLSDLAVHLGLREADWLDSAIAAAGLRVAWTKRAPAKHGKAKDRDDPLHAARAKELTSLIALEQG